MTTPVSILLVDDKIENLVALESILDSPDYRLVRAQNAEEALLVLLAGEFAAIVLDVKMPGMDGIELAQMVRARKKTQHVPILLLTAHAPDSMMAGYAAGAVDFLSKPIQFQVLRSKVAIFADLFRHRHALAESNRALEAEIEERRRAEERVRQLNEELARRVTDLGVANAELGIANAELESLSYKISHDLRAPLRQVAEFVRLLQDNAAGTLDAQSAEYLPLIKDAVKRMDRLIDDLWAFSHFSRVELVRTEVSLPPLVDDVRSILEPTATGRTVEWRIGALPTVQADAAMLRQVLINLLDNALKFTRNRATAVIEVGCTTDEVEHIVCVRDNGVGFDPAYSNKLFGVFQRLHGQHEFEGTGIGLATVQRIIVRHGGRTWAESTLGEGAQVYFSLPTNIAA
jgi:two-component system sensor histidine kinase/response regulator